MQKRWLVKTAIADTTVEEFRSKLKIDRIVAALLLQRGIDNYEDAEAFFRPHWGQLHDPYIMKDMELAVNRIVEAITKKEKILFFGDYDVDGTTAVALMMEALGNHYKLVDFYIPDRYSEGYGISFQGIDYARENEFSLIVALDCGIRAVEQITHAKSLGIDFIVCDHHNPGDELPDGIILNPKQADCAYPFKELSGCGVAYKLLQAIYQKKGWTMDPLEDSIDLVAVSIGADIVPVIDENRTLCYLGMERLNRHPRKAFEALLKLANRSLPVSLTDVVFVIAPRINAAGRLRSGKFAVELMISADNNEILRLSEDINADNMERRSLDQEITQEALALIENDIDFEQRKSTVVFQPHWHKGVVGIVASRLIEKYFRPTIVLTESNGKATGSARTVNDFNIYDALTECSHLLEQFGGHTHAAGMTLSIDKVEEFCERFDQVVREKITKQEESPEVQIDLELNFDEIFTRGENRMKVPRLVRILEQFEPHGPGNMKPIFLSKNVFAVESKLLKDAHIKLRMTQAASDLVLDGIAFNLSEKMDEVAAGLPFDIVYTLETNTWNNRKTLQLNIKDIRATT